MTKKDEALETKRLFGPLRASSRDRSTHRFLLLDSCQTQELTSLRISRIVGMDGHSG